MRIPDDNGHVLLFRSPLLTIAAVGSFTNNVGSTSVRITDADGDDITAVAKLFSVEETPQCNWAVLELDRPGFDGPFCTVSPSLI